uniref:Uncharacterized protein n=1 Tax=Picea glauca TaxID=3330 RepID=A0A101M5N1_PICGL|nr:hypothetical protein ABT39_MTgene1117 [Picea glauca]QHR87766.1 hypothetical protein Q903MT_gene1778 [Picea sitchensis]
MSEYSRHRRAKWGLPSLKKKGAFPLPGVYLTASQRGCCQGWFLPLYRSNGLCLYVYWCWFLITWSRLCIAFAYARTGRAVVPYYLLDLTPFLSQC